MKNRISILIIITILVLSSLACSVNIGNWGFRTVKGSGDVTSEEREVSSFSELEFSGVGDVYIELGDVEALRIEAEDNLLEYIETEVRGDKLEIGIRDRVNLQPEEPINFYLTVKTLDSIAVSGLGDIEAPAFEATRFSVDISGAGDVTLQDLTADKLVVSISGLGNLVVEDGTVGEQDVDISGAGDYEARDLESAEADVQLSGLGSATIWVTDYLNVEISGAGSVRYAGDPSVESSVSGLGDVEKLDD